MTPPLFLRDARGLPKILAGGPTRETSSPTFQLHREGLERQAGEDFGVRVEHQIVKDPGGSRWHHQKIESVAYWRQRFMEAATTCNCAWAKVNDVLYHDPHCGQPPQAYDALFMVDSDVILGPGVLKRMWEVDADVVYGVYLTYSDWGGSMHTWPQVWNVNPYGWTQECADALNAPGVNEVEVLGGGACTLIRGRGFESRYWPLLESLRHLPNMFSGEDRTYCLGLEARGIKQVAVTNLAIHHCYTLADQTRPALERIREKVGL